MKTNLYVQYQGQQICESDLVDRIKSDWRNAGRKIKDMETLDLYVKPEERRVYYAINGEKAGEIGF
nr:DUF6465 family protein [Ndongobacter massiliensis]